MCSISQPDVNSFNEGDEDAFNTIFDCLYPKEEFIAKKMLIDRLEYREFEDVTIEAFEKLWDRRGLFLGPAEIKVFLDLTVRNACINILRHQKVVTKHKKEVRHLEAGVDYSPVDLVEKDVVTALWDKVRDLPDNKGKVLTMLAEGKSIGEIAGILGTSENNVSVIRGRAINDLRNSGLKKDFRQVIITWFRTVLHHCVNIFVKTFKNLSDSFAPGV